jgi:hypothetical protein
MHPLAFLINPPGDNPGVTTDRQWRTYRLLPISLWCGN